MRKDYFWNTLGSIMFAVSFPILTILVTRIQGVEQAGEFSVAFATAQMFMIVGNYAVRTYQVSDINGEYGFTDYRNHRYISCIVMILIGFIYTIQKGYKKEMFILSILLYFYKMIDALADVYEGELQKGGYLSKAGFAMFWRVTVSIIIFAGVLISTKDLLSSILTMIIASFIVFFFLTVIPVKKLNQILVKADQKKIKGIFKQCFPLFLSLFLLGYINNSPKYALEKIMSYEYQTYFNAMYFPSQVIYMLTAFIFKPLLVEMAEYWNDKKKNMQLFLLVKKVFLFICVLILGGMIAMYFIGISILEIIFGISLASYRWMAVFMIMGGGMIAIVNFMYHVLTVMREQKFLMIAYSMIFFISLMIPVKCVEIWNMWGACFSYVLVMLGLSVLLFWRFFSFIKKSKIKK